VRAACALHPDAKEGDDQQRTMAISPLSGLHVIAGERNSSEGGSLDVRPYRRVPLAFMLVPASRLAPNKRTAPRAGFSLLPSGPGCVVRAPSADLHVA
jgi:hypothetical protein